MALRRKKGLRRTGIKRRSSRIKPRNNERRAKMFERNFGTRAEAVRAMPCLVRSKVLGASSLPRCTGPIQAAHTTARGMGGCNSSRRKLVPLCAGHHSEQGTVGIETFEQRYGLDLDAEAERIAEQLDSEGHD